MLKQAISLYDILQKLLEHLAITEPAAIKTFEQTCMQGMGLQVQSLSDKILCRIHVTTPMFYDMFPNNKSKQADEATKPRRTKLRIVCTGSFDSRERDIETSFTYVFRNSQNSYQLKECVQDGRTPFREQEQESSRSFQNGTDLTFVFKHAICTLVSFRLQVSHPCPFPYFGFGYIVFCLVDICSLSMNFVSLVLLAEQLLFS